MSEREKQPHTFHRFDKRYYLPARPYGFALFRLYFRLKVSGVEHIPATGPVILVSNHTSLMDPPLLSSAVPRVLYFIMLHKHFYHRYFHWLFKRLPCIPVKRDSMAGTSALKLSLQVLQHHQILCIFPEGGISREHKARGFRTGAAVLALKTGAPVVPVGILGASAAFPLQARFPKPKPVAMNFGDPISVPEGDTRDKAFLQEIMTNIMTRVQALTEAPDT